MDVIFFALYKLAARSDFRFLQIPINLAFAAYLQENEILVLSRGGAFAHYLKPLRGFF